MVKARTMASRSSHCESSAPVDIRLEALRSTSDSGVPAPVTAAFLPIARRWRALTAILAMRGRRGESPHLSGPGGNVG